MRDQVTETKAVAVWRCAGCHCSTEVPVPKPSGCCPACGVYMWDDVRSPRPDPMKTRLFLLAVAVLLIGAGCIPSRQEVRCVVKVYRPDGSLHREYHGKFMSFDGRPPPIHNTIGGAAWVYLNERTIDAAAGWQIEVDKE